MRDCFASLAMTDGIASDTWSDMLALAMTKSGHCEER